MRGEAGFEITDLASGHVHHDQWSFAPEPDSRLADDQKFPLHGGGCLRVFTGVRSSCLP
jgi:hypothetical protein